MFQIAVELNHFLIINFDFLTLYAPFFPNNNIPRTNIC